MIRIGILGSDNSHALEFSKLANLPHNGKLLFGDVRVTHIYGHNDEETKKVANEGNIPNIISSPAEMLTEVDAVMVVFRDGIYHYEYAMPFIERGLPVWIDKPITIEVKQCKELIRAAKKYNSPLSGGSKCKFAADLIKIRDYVAAQSVPVKSALINFPIYLDSIYNGMHFYAAHLVEMTTEVFGMDIKAVYGHINGTNINAIFEYAEFDVHLCFSRGAKKYSCTLIEEAQNTLFNVSIGDIAENAFVDFVNTVRTQKTTYPLEYHLQITQIVDALKRSCSTNQRIGI